MKTSEQIAHEKVDAIRKEQAKQAESGFELYLAEKLMGSKLEPIGLYRSRERAMLAIGDVEGLISQLEIGRTYPDGIGIAPHWHVNETEEQE